MEWVVRGGISSPQTLVHGYGPHLSVPGLFGFSVQFSPGKSIAELAQAGRFHHPQISYATSDSLEHAIQSLGYHMQLVPSPGRGFHATLAVVYDQQGNMLKALPLHIATALSNVLQRMPNPHPAP